MPAPCATSYFPFLSPPFSCMFPFSISYLTLYLMTCILRIILIPLSHSLIVITATVFAEFRACTDFFQKGFQQQICQNSFNSLFFIVQVNSIMFLSKICSLMSPYIFEIPASFIFSNWGHLPMQISNAHFKPVP